MKPMKALKRVLALTLCVSMLGGNVMTTNATGTTADTETAMLDTQTVVPSTETQPTETTGTEVTNGSETIGVTTVEKNSDGTSDTEAVIDTETSETETASTEEEDTETLTEIVDEEAPLADTTKEESYLATYTDQDVEITVSAEAGVIPIGAVLRVLPLRSNDPNEEVTALYDKTFTTLSEQTVIDDFLAYDISFDLDGTEIEPTGSVSVSIEFVNSQTTEVSDAVVDVMHLKETDSNISVELVTDANIITDANAAVESASFVTDSFSVFTITWTNSSSTVKAECVDQEGNGIGSNANIANGLTKKLWYSCEAIAPVIEGYTFVKATYSSDVVAQIMVAEDGKIYYKKESNNTVNNDNKIENNIKFVYTNESKTTVDTVSTKDNITLRLYDYDTAGWSEAVTGGKNDSNATQGLVSKLLGSDLIPALSDRKNVKVSKPYNKDRQNSDYMQSLNHASRSLYTLFGTEYNSHKTVYSADKLFTLTNGYYSYDSSKNYASYQGNGEFKVYGSNTNGNFYPFNSYFTGEAINNGFGLSMETSIVQPEAGKVNDEDMVFSFSGDDDVWVFIDGYLVLDIGGSHGAISGTINFASGEVKVNGGTGSISNNSVNKNNCYGVNTTFTKIKDKINTEFGENTCTWDLNEDGVFEDWSSHEFKFFYTDHGGASNCKLNFNLQTVPTDSISVTKKVSVADNTVIVPAGTEYSFKLYTGKTASDCKNVTDASYDIYKDGVDTGEDGTVGSDGVFKLKAGEKAVFSVIKGTYYYVEELGASINADDVVVRALGNELTKNTDGNYAIDIINSNNCAGVVFNNCYKKTIFGDTSDVSKTAKVISWDDRTYEINLNANVYTTTEVIVPVETKTDIDVIIVMDTSKSMDFPSSLKKYEECKVENLPKKNDSDKEKIYYYIDDNTAATVHRVFYKDGWREIDASESGNGTELGGENKYTFYTQVGTTTRLDEFKKALMAYINELSDGCNVGLVTFNEKAYNTVSVGTLGTDDNRTKLLTIIDGLNNTKTASGTRQDLGLGNAMVMLQSDAVINSPNTGKYVILATDGCPSGTDATAVEGKATNIKKLDSHPKIFAIGIDMNLNKRMEAAKEMLNNVSSNGTAYEATSDNLNNVFADILKQTTNTSSTDTTYKVGNVRDYIDDRFEILITDGTTTRTATVGDSVADGRVKKDVATNQLYIEWEKQELKNWTRSITVRAKENYIGGNNVTTNGEKSGIYIDGNRTVAFEQPTVNVKASLAIENFEKTIFFGETVPTEDAVSNMFKNQAGFDLSKLTFTWYTDSTFNTAITSQDIGNNKPSNTTMYYLKVTYDAGEPTIESNANTTLGEKVYVAGGDNHVVEAINTTDNSKAYGVYTIYVVKGSITITKEISVSDYKAIEGDPIFTFKIEGTTGNVFYKTLRMNPTFLERLKAKLIGETLSAQTTITDLPKDDYTITELSTLGFTTESVTVGSETTCASSIVDKTSATFKIGTDGYTVNENHEAVTGHLGYVTFVNERNRSTGKLTDTDAVKNSLVIDGDISRTDTVDNAVTQTY